MSIQDRASLWRDRLFLGTLLLAFKLALLWALGPAFLPDTGGYQAVAEMIATGTLGAQDLTATVIPPSLFRIVGYPLVIAAVTAIGGAAWPWLLVGAQLALSVAATVMVHATARRLGLSRWASLGAALAQATSLPLVLDQAVLTDSLYGSLTVMAACLLLRAVLAESGRAFGTVAAAGMLVALAFLLREATLFLAVGFLPLAALAARGCGRWAPLRAATLVIVFVLPLALVQHGYREWNRARIGLPIITTGGQTNMIFAISKAARHDPGVFDGDSPVARASRATFQTYEFVEVLEVNQRLFAEYGLTAPDIAKAGTAAYLQAWRQHFMSMLMVPLNHLRANQAQLTIRPLESVRELILWCKGDDGGFARWRAVKDGKWWMAPVAALDGVSKAAAVVVFAAFALLTPWRLWRGDGATTANLAMAGGWLLYFCFLGAYALVHLETRYVAPVVPLSILGGFANLAWLASIRKAGRRPPPNAL